MSGNTSDTDMGCRETGDTMETPNTGSDTETQGMPPGADGSSSSGASSSSTSSSGSDQPDSPLSSSDVTSRASPQNITDSDAPVLTPVNSEHDDGESRKRRADETDPESPSSDAPESHAETKRPRLEEADDQSLSVNDSSSASAKHAQESSSADVKMDDAVTDNVQDEEHPTDVSVKSVEKDSDINSSNSELSNVKSDGMEKTASDTEKPSAGSQGDSDKENTDVPIDLSLGVKSATTSDAVMLLDEENPKPLVNGFKEMTPEQLKERRHLVKRLQDELRNEEAKLVLLKKIRQSQMLQHLHETTPITKSVSSSVTSRQAHGGPPPLVKGAEEGSGHRTQYMTGNHTTHVSKVLTNQQGHSRSLSHGWQSNGPPPLIMAPTARSHSQLHTKSVQQLSSSRSSSHGSHSHTSSQPEQTPAQRQAAAKLALRKQLEKTLLQIPPPKPPPPEMNFIPSLAGSDFMILVGLEEVVKYIIDFDARAREEKAPEVKYVFNPFVCVQCGTDFTPVWKRDKPGSKNVICEQCVTTNQKKALKQEHTNRLKSAFVKALQQEQEIEQRMQAQTTSLHRSSKEHERDRDREHSLHRDGLDLRPARPAHGHSVHSSSHHSSSPSPANPVNLSTSFKATNEQIRQHQNLIQAHQAQLHGAAALSGLTPSFNHRLMFQFSPQHLPAASSKADLQRQYLLDMIPPRSLPGSNALWRT